MLPGFVNHMRRMLVGALIALVVCATHLVAQSTTDGAIGGTVFDASGALVPKAQISVRNNGTNAEQTATADDSGYYLVIKLQPGSYTVTISHEKLATYKVEQVIVQVGAVTEVSPHLGVAGTRETVEVIAEAPQINYVSPDFAPNFNQTAISNLPINGGRWSSFAILTPGAASDSSGFGLLSFRGMSALLNNNTVDGADNNQAFFSEERGRTRAGYSTPLAAVDEFQVNTSNYSSEYGRSAGAVINTVTKSGTNNIHGEAYYYRRNNTIGAANEFTTIAVQTAPGTFSPVHFKPTDLRDRWGLGIGGPVMKDKLFWFLAYDGFHHNFPGTAVTGNPTAFFAQPTCSALDTPGNVVFPCTPTSALGTLAARLVSTQQAALNTYNTDLAALTTMLGPTPRTGDQDILFPKIDWQVNQKNRLSVSVNRMRWWSPAGIQTQATNTFGIASFGNDYVKDTWGVAKFDSFITANLSNQVRFQYGRDFEFENGQKPTPYEQTKLLNTASFTNPLGLPPQVSITNGFAFGLPSFLLRPAFPNETRQQIADTMSWIRGKHSLKFGMDFSHVDDDARNLRNQFGSYSYTNLVNYFSDLNAPNTCRGTVNGVPNTPVPCYSSFTQAFGPQGFEFTTNDMALFVQDDWKILPRLSLSLGVRYEREFLPSPFSNLINPLVPQTGQMPNDKNNLGPRVGFAWDVFGDTKTVLRGGWGIYYGRIINSTIFTALTNTGMPGGQNSLFFRPTTTAPVTAPAFPVVFSSLPAGAGRNITFFDTNFQNPQIRQMDLILERNLGWGTVVSASYLGSFGKELPDFVDTNLAPAIHTITYNVVGGGPLAGPTYTTKLFDQPRPDLNFGSKTAIVSRAISNYNALVLQINHRFGHHIQFSSSYTWSHALDNGVNGTTFADTNDFLDPFNINRDYGNSDINVRSRFVFHEIADSPWHLGGLAGRFANDWQLSSIYQAQSGLPYSALVSGDAPGGTVSGINGSGGTNRLDTGRNTFRRPGPWVADARISKYITLTERFKLELSTDFFNLANKQNVTAVTGTGGASGVFYSVSGNNLTFNGFGVKTNSNSNFIYSPRQIQLGLRLKF